MQRKVHWHKNKDVEYGFGVQLLAHESSFNLYTKKTTVKNKLNTEVFR